MTTFKRKDVNESSAFLAQTLVSTSTTEPDLVGFREVSVSQFFSWKTPRYESEEENQLPEIGPSDLIVAVRGIILKPQFGFALLDQDEQGKWVVVCKTKEAFFRGSKQHIHYAHELPLAIPEFQPFASKKDARGLHTFSISSNNAVPVGSRGESCAQCVAAGHHIIGEPKIRDGRVEVRACGFSGNLLFCVFEAGRLVKRTVTNSRGKPVEVQELRWIDVTTAKRPSLDVDGNEVEVPMFVERPFVIRLKLSRSTTFLSPAFKLDSLAHPYVPERVESLSRYLYSLARSQDIFEVSSDDPFMDGRTLYGAPTEIYFVSTSPDTISQAGLMPTQGYAPVFARAPIATAEEWLEAAWETYRLERSLTPAGINGEPRPRPIGQIPVFAEPAPAPQALRSAEPQVLRSAELQALPTPNNRAERIKSMLDNLPRG